MASQNYPRVTNSYESIATALGTGSSGIITFSSIPSTYKHLQIRAIVRNTGSGSNEQTLLITTNSDTGANYATHRLAGNGSVAYAQSYTSGTAIAPYFNPENGKTSNTYGAFVIDLLDYANTSKNKTFRILGGVDFNGSGSIGLVSGAWFNTSAISSITLTSGGGSWTTATHFALYGIRG
jgi:hypothetical protein